MEQTGKFKRQEVVAECADILGDAGDAEKLADLLIGWERDFVERRSRNPDGTYKHDKADRQAYQWGRVMNLFNRLYAAGGAE